MSIDINEKATIINNNQRLLITELKYKEADSPEGQFIQPFVAMEASLNCQPLNKDDNKKTLKKYKKEEIQPWFAKYASTSRTLWRGAWFFDFLNNMLTMLITDRTILMSNTTQASYAKALAPYHSKTLKMAANLALKATKKREKFIGSLIAEESKLYGEKYTEENFYSDSEILQKLTATLAEQLLSFCKAKGLDQLP